MQHTHYASNVAISRLHAFAECFRFPVIFENHQNCSNLRIAVFDTKIEGVETSLQIEPKTNTGKIAPVPWVEKSFSRMGGKLGTISNSSLIIDITLQGQPPRIFEEDSLRFAATNWPLDSHTIVQSRLLSILRMSWRDRHR
jgi:hypothetical protein